MRLFIAICFPQHIKKALLESMEDLRRQGVGGNFSRKENLHLTLAFLGERDSYKEVCRAMDKAAGKPFCLSLGESGSFGDLYWAGLKESCELLSQVGALREELKKEGIWFDKKSFRPHITILRKARNTEGIRFKPPQGFFEVTKLSLMRSERINGKLTYTEIYSSVLK